MAEANRGPWIIAGAIVLAVAVAVGAFVYMKGQDREREEECRAWQAKVAQIAAVTELDPAIVAGSDRPEGCPIP